MNFGSNLKSPKELFEEKRLKSLADLERQKLKESESISNKRVLPPKLFFNENVKEEIISTEQQTVNEETVIIDPYQEKIELLQSKIEELKKSIPEEVNLDEIFSLIENLKNTIDNLPKPKDYSSDIENIRFDIIRIEDSIPVPEVFDPSNLYENISTLKNLIQEVRSEIPEIPQPILYDNQLEELKLLVDNVRSSIPFVPEVKYYDEELKLIIETIDQVRAEIPEIKYYDNQINEIEEKLKNIEDSIPTVPEIKYYDEDIKDIQNKIKNVEESIPEVKYYDEDVKTLGNKIEDVISKIPTIPEIKYYDEDVKTLQNKIEEVRSEIPTIPEIPEVKYYDNEIEGLTEEVKGLYEKLSSIKIPSEDAYVQKVKELYVDFENKNKKLLEKINYLEEVFEKFNEKTLLQEDFNEPPSIDNKDPLTPLDKNFVTLDQLQQHYRLFINRIQQQLATIGGGGETRLEFLDDVDRNTAKVNGNVLQYDANVGKFIGTSYVSGSSGDSYWSETNAGIYTTGNVAIGTDVVSTGSTALWVQGDARITGIVTASAFVGDGSGLTGIVAVGSGVEIRDNNSLVGTASTLNFGTDLDVTFSGSVATINVSIPLSALTDVNTSNLSGISTDYIMVYDPTVPGFKFVNPKTYFGINNDANPDPTIDDFGSY